MSVDSPLEVKAVVGPSGPPNNRDVSRDVYGFVAHMGMNITPGGLGTTRLNTCSATMA